MLSGILFQLAGYWMAWALAFAIIGLDIAFRLLMVEKSSLEKRGMLTPIVECLLGSNVLLRRYYWRPCD
jgi:hypothetical protein